MLALHGTCETTKNTRDGYVSGRTAMSLAERGLAKRVIDPMLNLYEITDAGRAALTSTATEKGDAER